MTRTLRILAIGALPVLVQGDPLESKFNSPPRESRPETWFHLISGNVSKAALSTDLEAISGAGIRGIQLFHGKGRAWPGVEPQIQCLSPMWDDMIGHVADETKRLGLRFTMQNCPGWAMSGGPWITPDKAMRHLVWSRRDVVGGSVVSPDLAQPQPSGEDWRDYRDIAVLAFPTPAGDDGKPLRPASIRSNRDQAAWKKLLDGRKGATVRINPGDEPSWLELSFAEPTPLRSIELPPVETLMRRMNFDPATRIRVQVPAGEGWRDLTVREVPRGTWQDRQPEHPLVLAIADGSSARYRIVFDNGQPMELSFLRLSSAARVNDWRGQAGFALRSLDRGRQPVQDPKSWVSGESVVDLTGMMDDSGKLAWNAPAGNWTVLRYGHVNTGVKNKPAPPEATGFECDKLSPAGAEQHFVGYIGRLSAPGGPADGGRLQGMLIDSWECYTQTWTPAMEREFEKRRGYALPPWLPALSGWVIDDHATSERFLRDWRETISDLLVEHYFGRLASLARERGMQLSFETAIGDVSPGDILRYHGMADIPMCEFWQPNDPHWGGLETKPILPTASAAHIYGKPRIAAEAFTNIGLRWDEHPFMLKHLADRHFSYGVNHLVFHTYTHNPLDRVPGTSFGGRIGSPFLRGQTWWRHMPAFTGYLARCQHLLQQGRPVADVLWYLGDDFDHKPRQDRPFPDGHRFDYLNQDVLLHRLEVADGVFRSPEGLSWKVLWLPPDRNRRLTAATLGRLRELLDAGGTVVADPPVTSATLSGGAEAGRRFERLRNELWRARSSGPGESRIGKGRLLWGQGIDEALATLGIAPDVTGSSSATWCHRRADAADIYFVAAGREMPLAANLSFRATGRPEFWDPLSGSTEPVAVFHREGEHTVIPLDLPAAGSIFVVFRSGTAGPAVTRIDHDGATLVDATDANRIDRRAPARVQGLTNGQPVQPWVETPFAACTIINDDGRSLLAWKDGDYRVTRGDGSVESMSVSGTRTAVIDGPWSLSFPPGWDAPGKLDLPVLRPWSALDDRGAAAFSGTATYGCTLKLEVPAADSRILLDLGRVANIAEVKINGQSLPACWAPPFRFDLTTHIRAGSNRLEVAVTNTWHNRLAHDASLKPGERKTWTIHAPAADAPRQQAGLIGPVTLRVGKLVGIGKP